MEYCDVMLNLFILVVKVFCSTGVKQQFPMQMNFFAAGWRKRWTVCALGQSLKKWVEHGGG
jgi:hypothetical protein